MKKHGLIRNAKECIEQAAEETIGREKIINEKTWFNTECRIKIEEKAKARLKWLSSNRMEDEEDYKKLRSACNKYLRACKRKWINDNINEIENDRANKNTKSFFQKIKEQKKQYKGVVTGIKEKNGRVVKEESQYKNVWIEHFKGLLFDEATEDESEGMEESQYKNVWIEHFKGLLFDEATEDESEGMDEESCEKGEEEPSKPSTL
ncbi:hypothetical protein QE152_g30461 [Popillia japonica]|uniref:Uncharacterized protein n=1 Tax=Popillia japonica TaxID=7064 RepID=A0AAW1JEP6_POPJA